MTNSLFKPGQRWVSNTEAELGLGVVAEVAGRRVELSFPAAAERRTYALDNAPLSRVQYQVGQSIATDSCGSLRVEQVEEEQGLLFYRGVDAKGCVHRVAEIELDSFVQFSTPSERLFAGQIDKMRAYQLRCASLTHSRRLQQSPVSGLLGPRVQLLAHQLYIAHEVASRFAPRVLLADEVGLGKTIEAGMVIHQQLITGRAARVLIVVPDSLLHQWLVEMLRRFNLSFTILDEQRCQAIVESDQSNPFETAQLVLCKQSFLVEQSRWREQAQRCDWDLMVVDEAHHLQWSEASCSPEYSCIESLARCSRGLLLLTATPEQLGLEGHFARLRLLDPDRYYDLQAFRDEALHYQEVNQLVRELLDCDPPDALLQNNELLSRLSDYVGAADVAALSAAADASAFNEQIARVVQHLTDRHGTGRVLFRNTRSSINGFPGRVLHAHALPCPHVVSLAAAAASLDQLLHPESLLGENWLAEDSRIAWLSGWLKQHRSEKVLLICARAKTAIALEEYLRLRIGISTAVFHEELTLVARDRAAAYFADLDDGAQLLICSEIGSEGRNFQFAHHLIMFDLPLDPDLLEQRIGRLDRIGQRQTIQIHVPYYQGSAQQRLLHWYHQGLDAFEHSCAVGAAVLQRFGAMLHQTLCADDDSCWQQLLAATREHRNTLVEQLRLGRDRLLEINSCNKERAEQIVEQLLCDESRQELSSYMEQLFDLFGIEQEHHTAISTVLRPSDHMLCHSFPALPEDGVTVTYQRDMALSREDVQFLTWEHPMVSGAMDMVLNGDFGNTAFCTLRLPPLKPGTLLLEAVYVLLCAAPARLQLGRFLPLTTVRIVVDAGGKDLSGILTAEHLDRLGESVPRRNAQELVRHARAQIEAMLVQVERLAQPQKQQLLEAAVQQMHRVQSEELQRLQALAQLNANIRQEEIEHLSQLESQLAHYLNGASLKLDSLRLALVTDKR